MKIKDAKYIQGWLILRINVLIYSNMLVWLQFISLNVNVVIPVVVDGVSKKSLSRSEIPSHLSRLFCKLVIGKTDEVLIQELKLLMNNLRKYFASILCHSQCLFESHIIKTMNQC